MFSVSKLSRDAMPLMRQAYLRISPTVMPVRHLNLHEYQSKDLMNEYGINTQKFKLVTSADGAADVASSLNVPEYVIKAQVHAGGRGKGTLSSGLKGGVHLTRDPKVAEDLTRQMLGYNIFTQQTPPEGVTVKSVMIAQALDIAHESYFAILMDRGFGGPVLVASPQGGMDIEAVAEETPELIYKQAVDISKGLAPADVMDLVEKMGFTDDKSKAEAADQIARLYKLFIDVDATQVEINPFGKDTDGNVVCFDAKIGFDDNASFRQKAIFDQHDPAEDDPREVEAAKYNLNYIGLDGEIGCLVNGAGLAMATMDIIKLYGGTPANFLDVGGGASEQAVKEAFKIITTDKQVKGILVNIFGGIMKCDTIASGIINAAKEIDLQLPLVVRLAGTNVEKAKALLEEATSSGAIRIISGDDLDDAAQKIVKAIGGTPQ